MTAIKLLDSSIWLSALTKGLFREYVEVEGALPLISALSLFEIKRKLMKDKIPLEDINEKIKLIKKNSLIIEVNDIIAEKAAEISKEKNIPMADSLVYASAEIKNAQLITLDNDFRGLKNVLILEEKNLLR